MIRERLELHFDTLPEQSGQRSRLCGTVLSGLGVSRREPGCPGQAPGFSPAFASQLEEDGHFAPWGRMIGLAN